jgi:DNA-binding CsgD family transcriptional regulator
MPHLLEPPQVGGPPDDRSGADVAVRVAVRTGRPLFAAAVEHVTRQAPGLIVVVRDSVDVPSDVVVVDGASPVAGPSPTRAGSPGTPWRPLLVVGGPPPDAQGLDQVRWLPDQVDAAELCRAVLDVSRGAAVACQEMAPHGLAPRELEVLRLVSLGLTNEQIADQLFLSINTIKTYVRSGYRKIGATSRAQAVRWALTGSTDPRGDAGRRG